MEVEFETKAWITDYSSTKPADLATPDGVATLTFYRHDMTDAGWTLAGTAKIIVNISDMGTIVDNKVSALRAQAANIRAEATEKCTRIDGLIQQLLCIENNPTVAA